jgi:hypothetical protein
MDRAAVASLSGSQRVQLLLRLFARFAYHHVDIVAVDLLVARGVDGMSVAAMAEHMQLPQTTVAAAIQTLRGAFLCVVAEDADDSDNDNETAAMASGDQQQRAANVSNVFALDYRKGVTHVRCVFGSALFALCCVNEADVPQRLRLEGGQPQQRRSGPPGKWISCADCAYTHPVAAVKACRCPVCDKHMGFALARAIDAQSTVRGNEPPGSRAPQTLPFVVPDAFKRDPRLAAQTVLMADLLQGRLHVLTTERVVPDADHFLCEAEYKMVAGGGASTQSLRYAMPKQLKVAVVSRSDKARADEADADRRVARRVSLPPWLQQRGDASASRGLERIGGAGPTDVDVPSEPIGTPQLPPPSQWEADVTRLVFE